MSMFTFDAHFDGERLCPDEQVALPMNVRLRVIVVENADEQGKASPTREFPQASRARGVFGPIVDEAGLVDGPADWSAEIDHYLYGTPKRGDGPAA